MSETATTSPSVREQAKSLLGNSITHGIVGTMLLKGVSAIIAFSLFSLASNAAGAEEFGKFSLYFSIASLLSIVAAGGQELHIVRSWNEYIAAKQPALALGALRYGWIVSLVGVAIVGAAFLLFLLADFSETPMHIDGNILLAIAAVAFLAGNTLALFSSHVARAIVGIRVGDVNLEITWRVVVIVALVAALATGHAIKTEEILLSAAFGLMLVILIQTVYVLRRISSDLAEHRASGNPASYDRASWTPRSIRLWLASIMEAANQHLEVILIGILLDPLLAGAYFVASRLANAFALAADGINTFGTRRVPGLYFANKTAELQQTLRMMAFMSLLIVTGGILTVLVAGDLLLLLFGSAYTDYYPVLLLLSVGTGLTAAAGPAPAFLMLTGHEGRYMKIVILSVALRVLGFVILIPLYGITGAAAATACVMVGVAFWLNHLCRKLTGMDPSILRLIRPSDDHAPLAPAPSKAGTSQ